MKNDSSKKDAHSAALLGAFFLGGAAALFSVIAAIIRLTGKPDFEVDLFGIQVDHPLGLLMAPFVMFALAYLFIFISLSAVRWLTGKPPQDSIADDDQSRGS